VPRARALLPSLPASRHPCQPQIAEFIKSHAKKFEKQLSVREVAGAYPRLVLSGGGERTSVRIDNWKKDTILEFLRDKLREQQA
jgi:hypothetical protein